MHIGVVTLFPEMFTAISEHGVSSRAIASALVELQCWNPRDFTTDKHRTVDDKPYGGGPGMLMKTEPLVAAVRDARETLQKSAASKPRTIYLSPQGAPLNQSKVLELAQAPALVLLCGRYQGVDARVIDTEVDEEISLGDFVLSGGEIAAMALIDAVIRFQPGALGDEGSAQQDSFMSGLLHSPQYTRPQEIEGRLVPEILVSGDHAAIESWREKQSLGMTWIKRPDLIARLDLTAVQQELLNQFISEYQADSKD